MATARLAPAARPAALEAGPGGATTGEEQGDPMPRHRAAPRPWWRRAPDVRPRLTDFVKLVDVGTRLTHLLTRDAHAAGVAPKGRYWALCGRDVLPAALVDPGSGRYCHTCLANAVVLPLQRRRR